MAEILINVIELSIQEVEEQDAKQYKELQVNAMKVEVEKLKKEVEEERIKQSAKSVLIFLLIF